MTIKIAVVDMAGGNGEHGEHWAIHAEGCQDVTRMVRKGAHLGIRVDHYEVESIKEFVAGEIASLNADHGEGAWDESVFRVLPCACAKK